MVKLITLLLVLYLHVAYVISLPVKRDSELSSALFENSCGINQYDKRIWHGTESAPHHWPWMVLLIAGEFQCAGSIINSQWVVTAAHCVAKKRGDINPFYVIPGLHDLSEDVGVAYQIDQYFVHEFTMAPMQNDIALLRLQEPLQFTAVISPICLPDLNESFEGQECIAIGWGVSEQSRYPNVLNQVSQTILSGSVCKQLPAGYFYAKEDMFICATGPGTTCKGDSGGPLACNTGGSWRLAGIASFGELCNLSDGQSEAYYTNVSLYIDWEVKTIAENS